MEKLSVIILMVLLLGNAPVLNSQDLRNLYYVGEYSLHEINLKRASDRFNTFLEDNPQDAFSYIADTKISNGFEEISNVFQGPYDVEFISPLDLMYIEAKKRSLEEIKRQSSKKEFVNHVPTSLLDVNFVIEAD